MIQRRAFIAGTGTVMLTGCNRVKAVFDDKDRVYKPGMIGEDYLPVQPLSSFPDDVYPVDRDREDESLFDDFQRVWMDEPEVTNADTFILATSRTHETIESAEERVEKNRAVAIEYGEYPVRDLGDEAIIFDANNG